MIKIMQFYDDLQAQNIPQVCKTSSKVLYNDGLTPRCKWMVTEEEIEHVSKLMKIDIDDHKEYVDKVQTMIDYFDVLDSADVESEEISMQELPISNLREDKYVPFNEKLIDKLNNYKGTYVQAPKMS